MPTGEGWFIDLQNGEPVPIYEHKTAVLDAPRRFRVTEAELRGKNRDEILSLVLTRGFARVRAGRDHLTIEFHAPLHEALPPIRRFLQSHGFVGRRWLRLRDHRTRTSLGCTAAQFLSGTFPTAAEFWSPFGKETNVTRILMPGYGPPPGSPEDREDEERYFYEHLQLVLDHADDILANERYFYSYLGNAYLSTAYFGGDGRVPLGALLLLWLRGELLTECRYCDGTVYIIGGGGSSLSGNGRWWGGCIQCARPQSGAIDHFGGLAAELGNMIQKYHNEPIIRPGKRPKFHWGKGLVGEYTPDVVIKESVRGVSPTTLIRHLKKMDAKARKTRQHSSG